MEQLLVEKVHIPPPMNKKPLAKLTYKNVPSYLFEPKSRIAILHTFL